MTSQYLRLFHRHVLRYLAQHRFLALLNILSVALGVAVYLAIQIANQSANRAFAATIDVVAGKAELQITGPVGGLPDAIFPAVAQHPGIAATTPILRGVVTLPDLPGEYLQVLGVDIFTNEPFRTFELTDFTSEEFDVQRWLGEPDTIAVSEEFARAHGLKAGDRLRVQVNAVDRELHVGFILRTAGTLGADMRIAAMDIGWAQEFFGRRGTLGAIQLRLTDPRQRDAVSASLRELVPADARIASPAQRSQQVENMLSGFQLNLTAMSLVSLLVGMFLIYNTVSASVVRRRSEIGILRSLGVTRHEIRALFLGEALALGGIGVVVGLAGGVLLARGLVGPISETISSLYVLLSVRQVVVTPFMLISGALLGLGSVLIAAWLPAAAAAKMDPVRALHAGSIIEQSETLSPRWLWAGLFSILFAGALSFFALATGPAWLGFGATFFVLIGFSFLVPKLTIGFSVVAVRLLGRGKRGPVEANLAAANVSRSLVRNSVTIAALGVTVSMAIAVSVMVFSFRGTVGSWIDQTLSADLFIAPASNEIVGASSFIPPEVITFMQSHPAIDAVDTFRDVGLAMGEETIAVAVVRGVDRRQFQFLRGDEAEMTKRFLAGETILISESFSRRHRVKDGQSLELVTPDGPRRFLIGGTFYDYSRDQGVVYMNQKTFVQFWKDDRVHSLAVYLGPKASAEAVTSQFRNEFSRTGQFMIYSNRELRTRIFQIFDQTFAVTYVLRTIAVLVAIVGICLTLMTLIAERSRELGVLRAIGASVAQIRRLLLWESAMIGFLAALMGLASGLCLSLVLTGVINRAFFGWTIQLAFPWSSLAVTPVWIIAAALLAGILPAWRAGRLVVAEALREE